MVQSAYPDRTVQIFTMATDDETAEHISSMMHMALDAYEQEYEGSPFAVAVKVHLDPVKRNAQYMHLLQLIERVMGPQEGEEEFQQYFSPNMIVQ